MNLNARLFAVLTLLAGTVAVTGCSAAPDNAEPQAGTASEEAFSAAQCKEIHHQFIADLNQTNDDYKECVADAQRKLMASLTDIVVGNFIAAQPCVGSALASILTGKCLLTDNIGSCMLDIGAAALENIRSSAQFATCAANLGAEGAEGEAVSEEYFEGVKESLYVALAIAAAHTIAYVATYSQCADQLSSDSAAAEPIACNPAKSICFDAPGCPTMAKTHSSTTHMTGMVDRSEITKGAAVDTKGNRIACASYTVQGFSGGASCHAN